MLDRTTTALISDIKRMGSIPSSQSLYSDADFVDALNDAQAGTVVPQIMRVREEFFVASVDIPTVSGQRAYDIPTRSIGHKVRQVIMLDTQGNEVRLSRVEPENKTWHENFMWWPGTKSGYWFEGNKINLTVNLDHTYDFIRIKYFRRPSELALVKNAAQVINKSGGNVLALGNFPSRWAALTLGSDKILADIQNGDTPFDSRADSLTITAWDSTAKTVTVGAATYANVAVGDWVCDEGECVIPQYPVELHRILTNYVLIDVLGHLGDTQGMQNAQADLDRMINDFDSLISNRDEGSPRKVFSRRGLWDTGGV